MLVAFFESIRYVGHLLPLSFLRVFVGYYYLHSAITRFQSDFLLRPRIAEQIAEWLPQSQAPNWYKMWISGSLITHWKVLAILILGFELCVGISYVIGYVVRPVAFLGILLCLQFLYISSPHMQDFYKTLMAVHIMFSWVGAGRCLGVDYFFYKRRRGFWW